MQSPLYEYIHLGSIALSGMMSQVPLYGDRRNCNVFLPASYTYEIRAMPCMQRWCEIIKMKMSSHVALKLLRHIDHGTRFSDISSKFSKKRGRNIGLAFLLLYWPLYASICGRALSSCALACTLVSPADHCYFPSIVCSNFVSMKELIQLCAHLVQFKVSS